MVVCAYNLLSQTAKPQEFSVFIEEEGNKMVGYSLFIICVNWMFTSS